MTVSRREFLKQAAAASAGSGAVSLDVSAQTFVTDAEASKIKWSKAPCRFCGTGCGVTGKLSTENQLM